MLFGLWLFKLKRTDASFTLEFGLLKSVRKQRARDKLSDANNSLLYFNEQCVYIYRVHVGGYRHKREMGKKTHLGLIPN